VIFEIQTFATSREQAVRIVENWESNASMVYSNVLQMLNQDLQSSVD